MCRRVMSLVPSDIRPATGVLEQPPELSPERVIDASAVDGLIDQAFGPGRFVKAAERLREGNRPAPDLSLVAWSGGEAVGCVRMWPILIGSTPALLLGPFAVTDAWRSR